jgi:DNA-binding beta-propeller fold protein YncE
VKELGFKSALLMSLSFAIVACDKSDEPQTNIPVNTTEGLYVVNEGNWGSGNATLSYYNPQTREVTNEVFYLSNGMRLGDVAQSMSVSNGVAWVVVNNSNVVYALDALTKKELGRIDAGLVSPRYVCAVSADKVYISQMYSNKIAVVDAHKYEVTGYIEIPGMEAQSGSTEQMVLDGTQLYVSCWTYQKEILRIDTTTDSLTGRLEVGIQPSSLVLDKHGKLWTLADGGYNGNPLGYEAPQIVRIDAKSLTIEKRYTFSLGDYLSDMCLNATRDTLYWLKGGVCRMSVTDETLPLKPFISYDGGSLYSITVAPVTNDVYVADAVDYVQQGVVSRYSSNGSLLDEFTVGVCPGAFCWQ